MTNCGFLYRFKIFLSLCIVPLFVGVVFISESNAVTRFGDGMQTRQPVPIDIDDIWFYDADMEKVIPEIDSGWVAVVFVPMLQGEEPPDMTVSNKEVVVHKAKELTQAHDELLDFLYDENLLEEGVFFQLRKGMTPSDVKYLIARLNQHPFVAYAHPVLKIKENRYAFFNAVELEWKTGVASEIKTRILKQAHVLKDEAENVYRVDLGKIPLFKAINLLAEDIHIRKTIPYLVKLMPTIEATLSLPIHGGHVGDAFPFVFQVVFSDSVEIDPGAMALLDVRPAGIQKELVDVRMDPYDYVAVAAQSPIRISGTLKLFAPGEYTIPPIAVRYTCESCSNSRVRVIETKKVLIRVASIVPAGQASHDMIIPMDDPLPELNLKNFQHQAYQDFGLSVAAFAAAFLFLAAFIVRRKKIIDSAKRLQQQMPVDIQKDRLRALLEKNPPASHWQYVLEMNEALRLYLAAQYGFTGNPAGGSGDVFLETIRHTIPKGLVLKLKTVFGIIDRIVSSEMDYSPDLEKLIESVLTVLDQDWRQ